jgi:hypothetical protein
MVPTILVPSFRRISSARAAPAVMSNDSRASGKSDLQRMISSIAKPGIDQQGSTVREFPGRHRPPEFVKFEISNFNAWVQRVAKFRRDNS